MTIRSATERVSVDIIENGVAYGDVARAIQANPNIDKQIKHTKSFVGNATVLTHEAWIEIERVVLEEATLRLVAVDDLLTRGLVKRTGGMGKTVLQWQDSSQMEGAELSMDAVSRTQRDRIEYQTKFLPLPILHMDFSFSRREIEASAGNNAETIDTGAAREAGREVAELAEEILILGASAYTAGGGTIRGYLDFPSRNTTSLTANWDAGGSSGITIRNDVANMLQAQVDARKHGDSVLYIPTAYEKVMDDDYSVEYPKTIRERVLQLGRLTDIKVADKLTANNVILSEMDQSSIRLALGMDIQTVHWTTDGFTENFKVMMILIPNPRATQGGRSGIVHAT